MNRRAGAIDQRPVTTAEQPSSTPGGFPGVFCFRLVAACRGLRQSRRLWSATVRRWNCETPPGCGSSGAAIRGLPLEMLSRNAARGQSSRNAAACCERARSGNESLFPKRTWSCQAVGRLLTSLWHSFVSGCLVGRAPGGRVSPLCRSAPSATIWISPSLQEMADRGIDCLNRHDGGPPCVIPGRASKRPPSFHPCGLRQSGDLGRDVSLAHPMAAVQRTGSRFSAERGRRAIGDSSRAKLCSLSKLCSLFRPSSASPR